MTLLKTTFIVVAIALTVVPGRYSLTRAQEFGGGLPPCAEPALFEAVQGSKCKPLEVHCICADKKIFPAVEKGIKTACNEHDQAAVRTLASEYCKSENHRKAASPGPASHPTATTAMLPSSITSPALTITTSKSATLVTDTTSLVSTTYHKTVTHSTTSTASATSDGNATESTGTGSAPGAAEEGYQAVGLAAAMGVVGWMFGGL